MKTTIFSAIALLLVLGAPAKADTTITTSNNFGGNASKDRIYIKDGKIRVNSGRSDNFMIFDSSAKTITSVDPSQQQYTVITEEDLKRMGNAMQQAMQRLEQQLANLPPEQREQMRQMMKQRMGAMMGNAGGPTAKPEIVRTGQSRNVAGYDCQVVRIVVEGETRGNACMTGYSEIGIPKADRQTIESMMDFSLSLTEHFGDMMPAQMRAMAAEGYPVQYESHLGDTSVTGTLESVETGSISGDLFTIPAGYSQRRMPTMPGG